MKADTKWMYRCDNAHYGTRVFSIDERELTGSGNTFAVWHNDEGRVDKVATKCIFCAHFVLAYHPDHPQCPVR